MSKCPICDDWSTRPNCYVCHLTYGIEHSADLKYPGVLSSDGYYYICATHAYDRGLITMFGYPTELGHNIVPLHNHLIDG